MRRVSFEKNAFQDYNDWAAEDKKIYRRITALILDILRQPFHVIDAIDEWL